MARIKHTNRTSKNTNGTVNGNGKKLTKKKVAELPKPVNKAKDEEDIQVVNTVVSCLDIISRQRTEHCVKSARCKHIECFDLKSFCEVNNIINYYEKEHYAFSGKFDVIPAVNHVRSKFTVTDSPRKRQTRFNNATAKEKKYMVTLSQQGKKSPTLFKVVHTKDKSALFPRNLTTKQYQPGWIVRCPLCSIKFCPSELMHDDFMTTVLKYVPKPVRSIEISEDWIVSEVKEKSPFQNQEVVAIDDDDLDNVFVNKNKHSKHKKHKKHRKQVNIGDFDSDDDFDDLMIGELENTGSTMHDPVIID
ncbi:unnamed protein product [Wickerhamomyces anomalus]